MALIEPVAFKIGRILLECLCEELANVSNEDDTIPMPQRRCFRAGSDTPLGVIENGFVITDQCCLGEAYVKYLGEGQSTQFPTIDEAPLNTPCQFQQMAISYEIGIIRCISQEPDCTESSEKVRLLTIDSEVMERAVCCWQSRIKKEIDRGTKWFAGNIDTGGPDGGCLMSTMPVWASRRGPGCC